MAAVRSVNTPTVGSSQWIADERDQVSQFIDQEVEDFAFAARNEVDWLNEHMAEIFSATGVNVTEIFKTPGKLRGKTPRTVKRHNAQEGRMPLTDVFSASAKFNISPSHRKSPQREQHHQQLKSPLLARFESPKVTRGNGKENFDSGYHTMTQDAMDVDEDDADTQPIMQRVEVVSEVVAENALDLKKDDETLTRRSDERRTTEGSFHSAKEDMTSREQTAKLNSDAPALQQEHTAEPSEADETDEAPVTGNAHQDVEQDAMQLDPKESQHEDDRDSLLDDDPALAQSHTPSDGYSPAKPVVRKSSLTFASLPAREPLTTKRSMGGRTSRNSQLDQTRANGLSRGSYLGRFTGGKSLGNRNQLDQDMPAAGNDPMNLDGDAQHVDRDELDEDTLTTQLHNKASTQRLHDRINMLGKSNENKVVKTATFAQKLVQPSYPELTKELQDCQPDQQLLSKPQSLATGQVDDDGDDWIKPLAKKSEDLARPQLSKSRSVDVMEKINGKDSIGGKDLGIGPQEIQAVRQGSPLRSNSVTERTVSAERLNSALPDLPNVTQEDSILGKHMDQQYAHLKAFALPESSTTPAGSPARLHHDGPLSASKSKLQSIMKSARGLFTSSAGASAQAKMELTPSSRTRSKESLRPGSPNKTTGPSTLSNDLYPNLNIEMQSTTTLASDGRKTRSSTDREEKARNKELKARQQMELDLQRARDQERIKAATAKEQRHASAETVSKAAVVEHPRVTRQSPRRAAKQDVNETVSQMIVPSSTPATEHDEKDDAEQMPPPPPRSQIAQVQIPKAKEVRRPVKPAKDTAPKAKPLPVAIKVGTSSQRIALSNAALSSSLQDSLPAPPPQPATRPATLTKKGSTASLQSTMSMKSSASSAAPKDEKEALRKLEHKREIERKRAAQQEEAQRRAQQEEAQRKEQQRRQDLERQEREKATAMNDPRKMAQKQAIEKRRMELLKKDQARNVSKPMNDLAHALNQDKLQQPVPPQRPDLANTRAPSRQMITQDFPKPPTTQHGINPAKAPAKRNFDPDPDDEPAQPVRKQAGPYQMNEAKRRRTEDEDSHMVPVRPTMEPPIRLSNIHKHAPKSSIFNNHYPNAPAPSTHHAPPQSLLKTSTLNQTYQQYPPRQPHEMAKYTNGKIPFAEAPNPPQAHYQPGPSASASSSNPYPPANPHKTPLPTSKHPLHPASAAPKSSPLTNGENIHLSDIATDDSSDADSEDERAKKSALPAWTLTPEIRRALVEQDTMDADAIFGPVQAPNMEDMFRDKGRQARFRNRTSSANWSGQDRLTEEEVRRDAEARERMRREGGWRFGI